MDGQTCGERLIGPTRLEVGKASEVNRGAATKARSARTDQTDSRLQPQIQLVSDEKSGNRKANIHTTRLSGQKKRKIPDLKGSTMPLKGKFNPGRRNDEKKKSNLMFLK